MTSAIDNILNRAFAGAPWLFEREAHCDVIVSLSRALGPWWTVLRETDCEGEVTIVVLPLVDDAKPAFVLYEKEGEARVAAVGGDDWEGDRGFPCFQEAVAGIISEVARVSLGAQDVISPAGDF